MSAALPLPVTNPVLIFALAMLLFASAPLLFERLRVPGMIGLLIAGAVVGPNGLNLLARDASLILLGTVGLLYIMFIAGVELDLHGFRRHRRRTLGFGLLTNLLPQGLGIFLGLALGYGWAASILLASMFASHTLVSYPIASRLGIARNEAVTVAVGGTIITDTIALLVLAVIAASVGGVLDMAFWLRLTASLAVFVALVLLVVPRLARWFFRNERSGATSEFVFVLATIFTCAWLAEVAGVEGIIGAFLAGLALNRLIPDGSALMNRLQFFGSSFFIPFFLVSVGMLVDVRVLLAGTRAWEVMLGMTGMVMLTKWLAARTAQTVYGYSRDEGLTIFGLTVPQAAATLAATLVGYRLGLFDDAVLNGSILMILVTCIVGPWTVEKYGRRIALREELKPYQPAQAPQRILIPMSNPATAEALLDLALLVRSPGSDEPLHPLTVVPGEGHDVEAQVADAERLLGHAVIHAAAAEVPVVPLTRVDFNFASGIARGIAETRSSTVIIGWDARRSAQQRIFGSVLDQLLEQTRQLVLVAKLGHPLNTTRRLVLVVPPGAERERGFAALVRTTKAIASRLGTPITQLAIDGDPAATYERIGATQPEVPLTSQPVPNWEGLLPELGRQVHAGDLVVVVSARRGAVSWNRELERIPGQIAQLGTESFIIAYPPEVEPAGRGAPRPGGLDDLDPRRIVLDLPGSPLPTALTTLLRTAFDLRSTRLQELVASLTGQAAEQSTLIAPGVIMPHARVAGLAEPMLFLGTSRDGVEVPGMRQRAHLIFLLLSPIDQPEEHLRRLADVARVTASARRYDALLHSRTADELVRLLNAEDAESTA